MRLVLSRSLLGGLVASADAAPAFVQSFSLSELFSLQLPGSLSTLFQFLSYGSAEDPKVVCAAALAPGGLYQKDPVTLSISDAEAPRAFVCRDGFFLTAYDEALRAPLWSAYLITPAEAEHEHGGRRGFHQDPDIPEDRQPSVHSKCWSQKWNRGHLCPSRIMSYNKSEHGGWADTYIITNTAMQWGHFNQQTWEHVESHVFDWIRKEKKELFIVTGTETKLGGLKGEQKKFLKRDHNNITTCDLETGEIYFRKDSDNANADHPWMAVPDFYYKALCDLKAGKSIVYVGHNRPNDDGVFEISLEDLKSHFTGLDLLPTEACGGKVAEKEYFWREDSGLRRFAGTWAEWRANVDFWYRESSLAELSGARAEDVSIETLATDNSREEVIISE